MLRNDIFFWHQPTWRHSRTAYRRFPGGGVIPTPPGGSYLFLGVLHLGGDVPIKHTIERLTKLKTPPAASPPCRRLANQRTTKKLSQ